MINDQVQIYGGLKDWRGHERPAVVAVGTFDGVHLGHKALVRRAIESARASGLAAIVLTFEPHPGELLRKEAHNRLSTPQEKIAFLRELGPDAIVVLDFKEELQSLSAEEFTSKILVAELNASQVHVGFNFHFGKNGQGNVDKLKELGEIKGFAVKVLSPVNYAAQPISSSRIRQSLKNGDVATARFFLGREYTLSGTVTRGEGRGQDLGFPTANLKLNDDRKLLPRFGVYLGDVRGDIEGPCLVSIGLSPTFGPRNEARVEVYIPSHDGGGHLYEQKLHVTLCQWMRPELRFDTSAQLVAQMKKDLEYLLSRTGIKGATCRSSKQESASNE